MEEGTIPAPHTTLVPKSDDDVVPVQVLSHFGAGRSGGGKSPVERSGFFNIFLQSPFLTQLRRESFNQDF